MSGASALRGRLGLIVAVALAALTLRPQLVGLGPVLPRAQDALGISHSVAALLSAIPVVGMGVFAPAAAPLAARVGAIRAVTFALALIAVGGIARAILPGAFAVIALTIPIAVGMGLGNALHGRRREGALRRPSVAHHRRLRERHPAGGSRHDRTRRADRRFRRLLAGADAGLLAGGGRIACVVARRHARWRAAPGRQARPFPAAQARRMAVRRALRDLGIRLLRLRRVAARRIQQARLVGCARRPAGTIAINLFAILSLGRRVARRRPLQLVAARTADGHPGSSSPWVPSASRSTRRTRSSGACMFGIGNGAIFPLMMTLPARRRRPARAGRWRRRDDARHRLLRRRPGAGRDRRAARLDRLVRRGPLVHRRDGDRRPVLSVCRAPLPAWPAACGGMSSARAPGAG